MGRDGNFAFISCGTGLERKEKWEERGNGRGQEIAFISRGTGRGRESNGTWTGLMNGVLTMFIEPVSSEFTFNIIIKCLG